MKVWGVFEEYWDGASDSSTLLGLYTNRMSAHQKAGLLEDSLAEDDEDIISYDVRELEVYE
jgi:hypothetical protein